jgi:formamidopyrimidine-DNA glycosylase
MPELPEVETVRKGLKKLLINKKIKDVSFDWPKSFPNSQHDVEQFVINSHVIDVRRRAKVLIIDLSTNYSFVIHLKMTGQMVFRGSEENFGAGHPNDSLIGQLPDKSTRVIMAFDDESKLFFNDQRKFGWMRLMPTELIKELDFFKKVGPEPLTKDFTATVLKERLMRRRNSAIKAVLLDQTVIAGIGNIYADESLWGAKIHPLTAVNSLSTSKIKSLHQEIQFVLSLAISKGGSTDKNYVDAEGKKGSYMNFARVFRREGLTCPRCNTEIIKIRAAGRGTHLCTKCQRLKA